MLFVSRLHTLNSFKLNWNITVWMTGAAAENDRTAQQVYIRLNSVVSSSRFMAIDDVLNNHKPNRQDRNYFILTGCKYMFFSDERSTNN